MRTVRSMLAAALLASMVATGGAVADVSEPDQGFVPGELILELKPGADPHGIAGALSAQVDRVLLSGDAFVLRIAGDPKALAAVARVLPGVRSAEPNWVRVLHDHPTGLPKPNDTDFGLKWDLFNDGSLSDGSDTPTHGADINWLGAYNTLKGESLTATVIAVLDTGIDASHPDLNDKLIPGWDFISNDSSPQDGYGHGTHVAGIAAAETNNGIGTAGVGFAAALRIMPIKVCDDNGQCPSDAIANGITFAASNGAKVINMSFGGSEISSVEQTAINNAHSGGVLIIASAGNSNVATENFPAAYEPVMAIAATDWDDGRASYSNYGSGWVDLAAPGGDMGTYDDPEGIYSTMPTYNVFLNSCRAMGLLSPCYDLNYDQLAGTSMAAPQVAGAAALLFAINAGSNTDIRSLIQNNAEAVAGTGTLWANGRLDIGAAVAAVRGVDAFPSVIVTNPANNSTVSGTVVVTATATDDRGVAQVEFFVNNARIGVVDADGSDGWSATWDTTTYSEGIHTVSATATDTGSQTSSHSVTVTVGNTAPSTMHVADLDGGAVSKGSSWTANVTILVRDSGGNAVVNATVSGAWSNGASGSASCRTNSAGTCTVSKSSIPKRTTSVKFTVTGVSLGSFTYDPTANTDPDTDSNGTTIIVTKP